LSFSYAFVAAAKAVQKLEGVAGVWGKVAAIQMRRSVMREPCRNRGKPGVVQGS
jgi:hypothetical protein